jgi:hypothetical protein
MKRQIFTTLIFTLVTAPVFSQDTTKLLVRSQGIEVPAKNPGFEPAGSATFRIRCGATVITDEPLFIIDGAVVTAAELKKMDPNNIASITVLKDITANALFGCRGESVVVIVRTKNTVGKTFLIKDKITNEVLPGATVDFILPGTFKSDTIRLISDSAGRVVTEKLRNNSQYQLNVSNVGYKTYSDSSIFVNGQQSQTIFLERDTCSLPEVVVISSGHLRGCRLSCVCYAIRVQSGIRRADEKKQFVDKIYPNPARRSQVLTVAFSVTKSDEVILQMVSADGKTVVEKKYSVNEGVNQIHITPDTKLAAGIYVLQIIGKDKKLISRHKLVLQ